MTHLRAPSSGTRAGSPAGAPFRPGFSLIELVVVVVLLGIVAGVIAPRLMLGGSRRAESTVGEIANLFATAGLRAATSDEPQRIVYDGSARTLSLFVRRTRVHREGLSAPAEWIADPLAPAITIENARIAQAVIDGVTADERRWSVDLQPGQLRPTIEILIQAVEGDADAKDPRRLKPTGAGWTLLLLPHASNPELRRTGAASASSRALQSIDLDAAGLGDRPW